MPLLPINLVNKYATVFGTLGPVREEWGDDILAFIHQFWKGRALVNYCRLKFEKGQDGYPHMHLALMLAERTTMRMFIKQVQKYMHKYQSDKPSGYQNDKQFSFRLFAVPCKEGEKSGKRLMDSYLDEPVKQKDIGGGNFIIEHEFDVGSYIDSWKEKAPDFVPAMVKWVKKYHLCERRGMVLPPLSPDLVDNCPDLPSCAERYMYHLKRRHPLEFARLYQSA